MLVNNIVFILILTSILFNHLSINFLNVWETFPNVIIDSSTLFRTILMNFYTKPISIVTHWYGLQFLTTVNTVIILNIDIFDSFLKMNSWGWNCWAIGCACFYGFALLKCCIHLYPEPQWKSQSIFLATLPIIDIFI